MDPEKLIEDLTAQLTAATEGIKGLKAKLDDAPTAEDLATLTTQLDAQQGELDRIARERTEAEQALAVKSMRARLDAQDAQIAGLMAQRTPRKHEYSTVRAGGQPEEPFAVTLWKARKYMDADAMATIKSIQIKALGEGGGANGSGATSGGYLVPPEYLQDLVELRRASAPLRGFVNIVGGVRTNLVYVPQQTGVSTVAWVAENATKPSTDEVLGQIAINIFTLAGIAKVSNQLLEDSSPAVDQVVRKDLAKGLGIEEDRAMINGSGTGQPTGILNTSGIQHTTGSVVTGTGQAASIYDDIVAAIGRIQAAYFGQPDGILMHPRTWTRLVSAKDTTGRYLGMGTIVGSQMLDLPGVPSPTGTMAGGTMATIFGVPVILDANMPVTLSTGGAIGNGSAVIVGAFKEAWLLERDGIAIDVSDQAGTSFEQNQTWFRGEERIGFTAQRLTSAFQVIEGYQPA